MILNNHKVVFKNLKVSGNLFIASEDMSGASSASAQADKGFKPIYFYCSGLLDFDNQQALLAFVNLARSVDDKGKRTVFTIADETANALDVKEVMFTDNLYVNEHRSLLAWELTFNLVEIRSNSELLDERIEQAPPVQQSAADVVAVAKAVAAPGAPQLSDFEQLLKSADEWLGEGRETTK